LDDDGAGGRGEFDGVFYEIPDDLLKARRVDLDVMLSGVEGQDNVEAFRGDVFAADAEHLADFFMHVDADGMEVQFIAGDTGEIQKVIDQACFEFDIAADERQGFAVMWGHSGIALSISAEASTGVRGVQSSWERAARK
jgi:hypothetical protein